MPLFVFFSVRKRKISKGRMHILELYKCMTVICIGSVRFSILHYTTFCYSTQLQPLSIMAARIPYVLIYMLAETGRSSKQVHATKIIPFYNTRATVFGSFMIILLTEGSKPPPPIVPKSSLIYMGHHGLHRTWSF